MSESAQRDRREYYLLHKDRYNAQAKRWYRAHKNKYRIMNGIPIPLTPEPEVCEICQKPPGPKISLCVDHDHYTKKFRGWLCTRCNTALAKLGDNIEGLRKVLAYLERTTLE